MALQGTLSDFGIADIFQLIGQQQKTGSLVLRKKESTVFIHFREGAIVSADVENRDQSERLGNMMVRSGLLTNEHLQIALQDQEKTLQKLGHILIEKKFIQKRDLDEFIYLQTKETLFKLFRWNSGTYEFIPKDIENESEFFQPISAEHILMDGFRIVDEWPGIRKKIGSLDHVFERSLENPLNANAAEGESFDRAFDQSFAQIEEASSSAPASEVPPEVLKVYELIDGVRDVNDLIWLSRLGEFETTHAVCVLLDEKYIQLSERKRAPQAGTEKISIELFQDVQAPRTDFLKNFFNGLYYSALTIFLLIWLGYFQIGPVAVFFQRDTQWVQAQTFRDLVSEYQMDRLALKLEEFSFEHGVYPNNLETLLTGEGLNREDLFYPWDSPYFYQPLDLGYELSKPFF